MYLCLGKCRWQNIIWKSQYNLFVKFKCDVRNNGQRRLPLNVDSIKMIICMYIKLECVLHGTNYELVFVLVRSAWMGVAMGNSNTQQFPKTNITLPLWKSLFLLICLSNNWNFVFNGVIALIIACTLHSTVVLCYLQFMEISTLFY